MTNHARNFLEQVCFSYRKINFKHVIFMSVFLREQYVLSYRLTELGILSYIVFFLYGIYCTVISRDSFLYVIVETVNYIGSDGKGGLNRKHSKNFSIWDVRSYMYIFSNCYITDITNYVLRGGSPVDHCELCQQLESLSFIFCTRTSKLWNPF